MFHLSEEPPICFNFVSFLKNKILKLFVKSLYWICYNIPSILCFVFWPRSMWNLSSLIRDQTCTPCIGRRSLNHWIAKSDQIRSVAQSCPTLCNPMNHSTPGLPVHHQLPEFTETHVYQVSDAIQTSHPLSSPSPLAPNPSQHPSLFQWVNSLHEVAKELPEMNLNLSLKGSLSGVSMGNSL